MRYRERAIVPALTPARVELVTPPHWRTACERQAQAADASWAVRKRRGAGPQVNCIFTPSGPGARDQYARAARGRSTRSSTCSRRPAGTSARHTTATACASTGTSRCGHCWSIRGRGGMDGSRAGPRRLSGRGRADPRRRDRVRALPLPRRRRADPAPRPAPVLQAPRPASRRRGSPTRRQGCAYAQRACAACAVTNTVAYAQACEDALGLAPDRRAAACSHAAARARARSTTTSTTSPRSAPASASRPGRWRSRRSRSARSDSTSASPGTASCSTPWRSAASTLRIGQAAAHAAREELRALEHEQRATWRELRFTASLQARLGGVGMLTTQDAIRLGTVGPSARAAGVRQDTRSESPRLAYGEFAPATPERATGDVAARLDMREVELDAELRDPRRAARAATSRPAA